MPGRPDALPGVPVREELEFQGPSDPSPEDAGGQPPRRPKRRTRPPRRSNPRRPQLRRSNPRRPQLRRSNPQVHRPHPRLARSLWSCGTTSRPAPGSTHGRRRARSRPVSSAPRSRRRPPARGPPAPPRAPDPAHPTSAADPGPAAGPRRRTGHRSDPTGATAARAVQAGPRTTNAVHTRTAGDARAGDARTGTRSAEGRPSPPHQARDPALRPVVGAPVLAPLLPLHVPDPCSWRASCCGL